MNPIILASASPRRRELLDQVGIAYQVIPSKKEEVITCTKPWEIVMQLAKQKAEDVAGQVKRVGTIVLGADTVVSLEGEVMGKPADEAQAFAMLSKLQGKVHQVYTGVSFTVMKEDGTLHSHVFYEETEVYVSSMTEEEILRYVKTKEPLDKAGSYGIQGSFAAFIEKINGDYNNVVGLPIGRVYRELKNILK